MTFKLDKFMQSSSSGYRKTVLLYLSCLDLGITENKEVAKTLGYGEFYCGDIFKYLLKNQLVSDEGNITSEGRELFSILRNATSPKSVESTSESPEQLERDRKPERLEKTRTPEQQDEHSANETIITPAPAYDNLQKTTPEKTPKPSAGEMQNTAYLKANAEPLPKNTPKLNGAKKHSKNVANAPDNHGYELKYGSLFLNYKDARIGIFELDKRYKIGENQKRFDLKIRPEVYLLEIIRRASPTRKDMRNYLEIYSCLRNDWQDILCSLEKRGIVENNDVLSLSDIGAEILSKIKTDFSLNMYFDENTDLSNVKRTTHEVSLDGIGQFNVPPPYFIAFKINEYYKSIRKDAIFQVYSFDPANYPAKFDRAKIAAVPIMDTATKHIPLIQKHFGGNKPEETTPAKASYGLEKEDTNIFFIFPDNGDSKKQLIANDGRLLTRGRNLLLTLNEISANGSSTSHILEEIFLKLNWIKGTNGKKAVTPEGEKIIARLTHLRSRGRACAV